MRQNITGILVATALGCTVGVANAGATFREGQYTAPSDLTTRQIAACLPEAERLCRDAFPDRGAITECMRKNRKLISKGCEDAFK